MITEVLDAAVPAITDKCFVPKVSESSNEYDAASSKRIVQNHVKLLKDLPRLQDVISIARNILTIGEVAQTLAAKARMDMAVFDVVTLCIKVTARGFTAEGTQVEEEKWQSVIDECKLSFVHLGFR